MCQNRGRSRNLDIGSHADGYLFTLRMGPEDATISVFNINNTVFFYSVISLKKIILVFFDCVEIQHVCEPSWQPASDTNDFLQLLGALRWIFIVIPPIIPLSVKENSVFR